MPIAQNAPADAALRERVFTACLDALAEGRPLLARELRRRLVTTGLDVDKRLVASVLYREGDGVVLHDREGRYSLPAGSRAPEDAAPEEGDR